MAGAVGARSRSSRASSTPPWEAASISTTSRCVPSRMATHCSHTPHGSAVGPFSQLTILARIRAVEVLPVPRGPAEQEGVEQPFLADRAHQRPDHVLLTEDLVGGLRPVLPVQGDVVGHVGSTYRTLRTAWSGRKAGRSGRPGFRAVLRKKVVTVHSPLTNARLGRSTGPVAPARRPRGTRQRPLTAATFRS